MKTKNIISLITIIVLILLSKTKIINLSVLYSSLEQASMNFNLITINSILVGFLFTSFGIFTSLNNTKTYRYLEDTSFIDDSQDYMLLGIYAGIASILSSIIIIFVDFSKIIGFLFQKFADKVSLYLNISLAFVTVSGFVLCIIFFICSIANINFLIKNERIKKKKNKMEKKNHIKELSEKIKNS